MGLQRRKSEGGVGSELVEVRGIERVTEELRVATEMRR